MGVEATGQHENLTKAYRQYVATSSFPYVLEFLNTPQEIDSYLEGIYNTILVKDIMDRKKISDTLTSSNRKSDPKTIEKYITSLEECFVIYCAKRYNIKGKEYLKSLEKYYVADIGLRNFMLGKKAMDVGHVLENVVYLELLRRGFKVYIGKIDDMVVDFVAQNQSGNTYIQVAASVRDETTLNRELRSLRAIKDNYPKLLLTLDEDPDTDYDGILRTNALDWLWGRGRAQVLRRPALTHSSLFPHQMICGILHLTNDTLYTF